MYNLCPEETFCFYLPVTCLRIIYTASQVGRIRTCFADCNCCVSLRFICALYVIITRAMTGVPGQVVKSGGASQRSGIHFVSIHEIEKISQKRKALCVCVSVCVQMCVYACECVCVLVCVCMCLSACACASVCVSVSLCMCATTAWCM